MTRILVVEDYAQTRAGVRDYLLSQGMEVSEASNTADALKLVHEWHPNVVVLDIVIPPRRGEKVDLHHGDGIRAAQLIKAHNPEIGIVFLSNHPYYQPEVLELYRYGGGLVFLFKGEHPPSRLMNAIHDALANRLVIDPELSEDQHRPNGTSRTLTEQERVLVEHAVSHLSELTEREWEILEQVAAARTNAAIAQELHIQPYTVQTHLTRIYDKAGLSSGEDLAVLDKRTLLIKAYMIFRSRHVRGSR